MELTNSNWIGVDGLITDRLILRSLSSDDLDTLQQAWTNEEVRQYLGGPIAMEKMKDRRRAVMSDRMATVRLPNETVVGFCELGTYRTGETELSYQFLPEFWGNGYAHEACAALIDWAFSNFGLDRLIAVTQATNTPSRRLLEKLGMDLFDEFEEFAATQVMYVLAKQRPPSASPRF